MFTFSAANNFSFKAQKVTTTLPVKGDVRRKVLDSAEYTLAKT